MVKLLTDHGAPANVRSTNGPGDGWLPLCLAARDGHVGTARVLIAARANVHATSSNGKTALEIASINRTRDHACQSVYELLHIEMVASVLEIALTRSASADGPQPAICHLREKLAFIDSPFATKAEHEAYLRGEIPLPRRVAD